MTYNNKKVLVYGLGESGKSAYCLLEKLGATVFAYDDNNIKNKNLNIIQLRELFLYNYNYCIISPAVSIYSPIVKRLQHKGVKIISEFELGEGFLNNNYVGVTGTDGKTTTVSILTSILSQTIKCSAVGNIGYPLTKSIIDNDKNFKVCEISSFMLETKNKLRPHIAILTNISQDHIDRHKTYRNYIKTKAKLFSHQKSNDFAIFNYDDKNCKKIAKHCRAKKFYFSIENKVNYGAYVFEDFIYFKVGNKCEKIMPISIIKLKGNHNIKNILASVVCAKILGINTQNIINAVSNFLPLPHRINEVAIINNLTYINDSKSTTIQSCLCAINSFVKPITLIIGGKSKQQNYSHFFDSLPANVTYIILMGENRFILKKECDKQKFTFYELADTLEIAIEKATENCMPNGVVLFSPSTASFDMFKNYIDRGEQFEKEVGKLKDEKTK